MKIEKTSIRKPKSRTSRIHIFLNEEYFRYTGLPFSENVFVIFEKGKITVVDDLKSIESTIKGDAKAVRTMVHEPINIPGRMHLFLSEELLMDTDLPYFKDLCVIYDKGKIIIVDEIENVKFFERVDGRVIYAH